MPLATSPSPRGPKALKCMVITHLVVAAVFIAFGFLMQPRVKRFTEDPETIQASQAKIQAAIAKETDLERLRDMARRGWEQEGRDWKVLALMCSAIFNGLQSVTAMHVSLLFLAWWGLTRSKPRPSPEN